MGLVWALNTTILTILATRNRPDLYTRPALLALVPNVVLSILLIPPHGAQGAAIAALAANTLLVAIMVPRTARLAGSTAWPRALAAPVAAGLAMAAAAAALSGIPWVPAALVSLAAYAGAFLLFERAFSPADFAFYASVTATRR